jgi:hypothetical protein
MTKESSKSYEPHLGVGQVRWLGGRGLEALGPHGSPQAELHHDGEQTKFEILQTNGVCCLRLCACGERGMCLFKRSPTSSACGPTLTLGAGAAGR